MNKAFLRRLHLWLSLPLGIFITLICLSGATLVFKNEIRNALGMPRVAAPHGHHASRGSAAAPWAARHKAGASPHGVTTRRDFFSYVTRFHTSLMLGTAGKAVVVCTTVLFILVLLSGAGECWPHGGRQWHRRLAQVWGPGTAQRLHGLHVGLGFWALLWLLLLAVTGAAFGLHLLPRGSSAMHLFHALHVGTWGGTVTKVLTFVASLVGASLPVTGYWMYFRRRRQSKNCARRAQR